MTELDALAAANTIPGWNTESRQPFTVFDSRLSSMSYVVGFQTNTMTVAFRGDSWEQALQLARDADTP